VAQEENWEKPFDEALATIRRGDFGEVMEVLESLGFTLVPTKNPDHWMYFHPSLKSDPHFAYHRNLFRPHGSKRDSSRITNRDASQAKQMIQALKSTIGYRQKDSGDEK